MKKVFLKIFYLVVILNIGVFSITGKTSAFFNNNLAVSDNFFRAGVLKMTLRSGQNNFVSGAEDMQPGQQVNRDIYVGKTADSASLQHQVSYEYISGDENLCNQLDLKIWYNHYHGLPAGGYGNRDMRLKYDGKLSDLSNLTNEDFIILHPDDQFDIDDSNGTEQWFFYSINLPSDIDDSLQGKTCHFDFDFKAWQTNIGYYGGGGFTDEKKIENTITTGSWTPVLVSIGDKSGTEGALLEFTIQATDPNGDSLIYSASNLPTGANFDPSTHTFSWTPVAGDNGTYPSVHFEVSDGKYTDSEDITIMIDEMPPPSISGVGVINILSTSADIIWNTDQLATSRVEYGLDTSYGLLKESLIPTQSHQVSLSGLTAKTLYHYRVVSRNSIGKETSSADAEFTTTDS